MVKPSSFQIIQNFVTYGKIQFLSNISKKTWCNSVVYLSFSNKENNITTFLPKLDLLKVNTVDICELCESLWTLSYIFHECFCEDYRVHDCVSSTYQVPETNSYRKKMKYFPLFMSRFFSKVNNISNLNMLNTVPRWNNTLRKLDLNETRCLKSSVQKGVFFNNL